MVTGWLPFTGETIYVVYMRIEKCEYEIPANIESDLSVLLRGILFSFFFHLFFLFWFGSIVDSNSDLEIISGSGKFKNL